jgi:hypothetical protein
MQTRSYSERYLRRKYQTGGSAGHNGSKAIQKELDGMTRLLSALLTDEPISEGDEQLLEVHEEVKQDLIGLEHRIVEDL